MTPAVAGGSSSAAALLQVVPTVQQDYSTFATNVRNLEASLVGSGASGSTIAAQVGQQVQTLATQVSTAIGQVPGAGQVATLVQQQIGGASAYGLAGAMNSIFAAQASEAGGAGLATLFQGVDGLMAGSFATTAGDIHLAAVGPESNGGVGLDASGILTILPAIQQDYASTSTEIQQLSASLVRSGPGGGVDFGVVAGQIEQQVQALASQVGNEINFVPNGGAVANLVARQIGGTSGFGLLGNFNALFAAAQAEQASRGSTAGLATLLRGVEGLLASSYATTAGDIALADTGQIQTPATTVPASTITHIGLGAVTRPPGSGNAGAPRRVLGVVVGPRTGNGASTGTNVRLVPIGRSPERILYPIVFGAS